jgi:hypothetical protein
MSSIQIPNLPVAIALNGTEVFEAVQAGVSVQVSLQQLMKLLYSQAYTVATLPSAATSQYTRAFVTDATATTFNSVVAGGGANKVPVWSDGANWRIG